MQTHAEYENKLYVIDSSKKGVTINLVKKDGTVGRKLSPNGEVYKTIWEAVKEDHIPEKKKPTAKKPKKEQQKRTKPEKKADPKPEAKKPSLSDKLSGEDNTAIPPHLIVEARAGTGKTTTLVEGLKLVKGQKTPLTPSPQQAAVWDSMKLSAGAKTVCFVAFNKSIAQELQDRVPEGCDAMTMHSMGLKAVNKTFELQPFPSNINNRRVEGFILDAMGYTKAWMVHQKRPGLIKAVTSLVNLCKMNLVGEFPSEDSCIIDPQKLLDLVSYYEVELNGNSKEVFELVATCLLRSRQVEKDGQIDFNDMIWLPVVLDLPVFKYDLLLIDEAQDLNRCQQALAIKAGKRLILCGDPKQAIYGFAGADAKSMGRMQKLLEPCTLLPLTVTRRCGKAIVEEAQKLVPDFESHESNGPGKVTNKSFEPGVDDYRQDITDGDMILCRCNAPLVSECFKFLGQGKKAQIQGRDIGKGLTSLIDKINPKDLDELDRELGRWLEIETGRENNKDNPCESKLINLQDKHSCLMCFVDKFRMDETDGIEKLKNFIESIFVDDRHNPGIKLSSIHKAKGLEADRVYLLQPKTATIPHPMAKTAWQREQEYNLLYVAVTRAIKELVHVS